MKKLLLILIALFLLTGNMYAQKKIAFMQNLDNEFQSHQDSLVSALEDESYQVTIVDISETVNFDSLATQDLVIISRTCNSSDVVDDSASWAALPVPYLVMSSWCIRSNRLRLVNSTSIGASADKTDTTSITLADPEVTDAIFEGVTTNGDSFNYYTGYYEYINTDMSGNSGQVLVSLNDSAVVGAGRPIMIRWEADVATYTGGVTNAATRTYMQIGSDDGPSNTPLNYENYTPQSLQLFLNEIEYLTTEPVEENDKSIAFMQNLDNEFQSHQDSLVSALEGEGYQVTIVDISETVNFDSLATKDLVIISRTCNSSDVVDDSANWAALPIPYLVMSTWCIRSNRLKLVNSTAVGASADKTDTTSITHAAPEVTGDIFDGVTTNGNPFNYYTGYYEYINTGMSGNSGQVLASLNDSAVAGAGRPIMIRWEADVATYAGGVTNAATRTYMQIGSDDGPSNTPLNYENYTSQSLQLFLNEVAYLIADTTVTDTTVTDTIVRIFPGAYGYGSESRGAYAGETDPVILTVDTLDGGNFTTGTNRGTFKWCLSQSYPRIIVFTVGGIIDWQSNTSDPAGGSQNLFSVNNSYLSIYGQTASSPGITIINGGILLQNCHDILIQHLFFRLADNTYTWGKETKGIAVWPSTYNIVIDHCSFAWGIDQSLGITFSHDITISNCLLGEPLDHNTHPTPGDEYHAMFLTSYAMDSVSIIGNLFAHGRLRAPFSNGGTRNVQVINNMWYNIMSYGALLRDETNTGYITKYDLINNYYKPGANTYGSQNQIFRTYTDVNSLSNAYISGNWSPYSTNQIDSLMVDNQGDITLQTTSQNLNNNGYTAHSALSVPDSIYDKVGARYWDRDSTDIRIIQTVIDSNGVVIDSTSQLDNLYLDITPTSHTLTIPSNPHSDSGNGYTNFEIWAASFPLPPSQSSMYTSIHKNTYDSNLKVYPNPNKGEFTINWKSEEDILLRITDIKGRIVYFKKYKPTNGILKTNINLSEQGKGMYLLQVISDKQTHYKKIMIE